MAEQLNLDGIPAAAERELRYSYAEARKIIEGDFRMFWAQDWVPAADEMFDELDLSEFQANRLVVEYAWRVKHLFNPSAYTWKQRIGLALRFLFSVGVT